MVIYYGIHFYFMLNNEADFFFGQTGLSTPEIQLAFWKGKV